MRPAERIPTHPGVVLLHEFLQGLRLRAAPERRPDQAAKVGPGVPRLVEVAEQAPQARAQGVDGRDLAWAPVGPLERLWRAEKGRDGLVVERVEGGLQAPCGAPGGELADVPPVLLDRVLGPAVGAELGGEPL